MRPRWDSMVGVLTFCLILHQALAWGAEGLSIRLKSAKQSFLEGEPVFVLLSIENDGTNAAEVKLGRRMLGNIVFWTDTEGKKKQAKRLLEGGLTFSNDSIRLAPKHYNEMLLLVDEWMLLEPGTHTLNAGVKWEQGDLVASAQIVISQASDAELESALKELVNHMAPGVDLFDSKNELYRRALKEACKRPRGKTAIEHLERQLTETNALEVVREVLKNYNAVIGD